MGGWIGEGDMDSGRYMNGAGDMAHFLSWREGQVQTGGVLYPLQTKLYQQPLHHNKKYDLYENSHIFFKEL